MISKRDYCLYSDNVEYLLEKFDLEGLSVVEQILLKTLLPQVQEYEKIKYNLEPVQLEIYHV